MKNILNLILIATGVLILASCSENDHVISIPESPAPEIPDDQNPPSESNDFTEIPAESRFKISLYDYFSFNGEKYTGNPAFASPAPFDFIGFRMELPEGFSPFGFQPYQCYDSIVWFSSDLPNTFRVFENGNNYTHLTTQWGSYFFREGLHTVYLKGYSKGEAVHSDSVTFKLKDRDFLCFNWSECPTELNPGVTHGIYCYLDNIEYSISYPIDNDGCKIIDIYLRYRNDRNEEIENSVLETELEEFLGSHLGKPIEYDEANLKGMFKLLPGKEEYGKLYENKTTRSIIIHQLPDEDHYRREKYYIHVESK